MKTMLEAKGIKKSFDTTAEVLKGVSVSVGEGETVSIIGPSGSGKSTLLRCIVGLERINGGEMLIDGERMAWEEDGKLRYLEKEELRRVRGKVSMVFQNFNLFPHLSVLDNLTIAPMTVRKTSKDEAESIAHDLLGKVGLKDKVKNYPCELSGGQMQRVAIARALAMRPNILCFDEPTSALDPELTGEVLKVIKGLAEEKLTMLIVTHEMGFARELSNKVVFMDSGMVVDEGTPEEIFTNTREQRIRDFLDKTLSIG